jgi:hypothetical protein
LQKQCRWPSESPAKAGVHQGGSPPPPKTLKAHNSLPAPRRRDPSLQTFRNRHGPRPAPGRRSTKAYRVRQVSRRLGRPGGHSEGQNTRSHPELGRENPQRRWYCASRRGRVGRRQTRQTAQPKFSSSVHVRSCDGPALRGIGCHCADQTRLMTKRAAASSRNAPKPISSQRAGRAWARRAPSGAT